MFMFMFMNQKKEMFLSGSKVVLVWILTFTLPIILVEPCSHLCIVIENGTFVTLPVLQGLER